jgi:hypothetical protein
MPEVEVGAGIMDEKAMVLVCDPEIPTRPEGPAEMVSEGESVTAGPPGVRVRVVLPLPLLLERRIARLPLRLAVRALPLPSVITAPIKGVGAGGAADIGIADSWMVVGTDPVVSTIPEGPTLTMTPDIVAAGPPRLIVVPAITTAPLLALLASRVVEPIVRTAPVTMVWVGGGD